MRERFKNYWRSLPPQRRGAISTSFGCGLIWLGSLISTLQKTQGLLGQVLVFVSALTLLATVVALNFVLWELTTTNQSKGVEPKS